MDSWSSLWLFSAASPPRNSLYMQRNTVSTDLLRTTASNPLGCMRTLQVSVVQCCTSWTTCGLSRQQNDSTSLVIAVQFPHEHHLMFPLWISGVSAAGISSDSPVWTGGRNSHFCCCRPRNCPIRLKHVGCHFLRTIWANMAVPKLRFFGTSSIHRADAREQRQI